ncbi:MAG: phosphotransferase family protein [Novosphingobium sp.]
MFADTGILLQSLTRVLARPSAGEALAGTDLAIARTLAQRLAVANDADLLRRHADRGHALLKACAEPDGETPTLDDPVILRKDIETSLTRLSELLRSRGGDPGLRDLNRHVSDWESELHALQADVPAAQRADVLKLDAATVQAYLRARVPGSADAVVEETRRLAGGYGRATVLVRMATPVFGVRGFVIRAEHPASILNIPGIDIVTEHEIIQMAYAAGVGAPEPYWLESGDNPIGGRFILLELRPGENYGTAFGATRDISPRLRSNIAKGLAAVHAIPVGEYPAQVKNSQLSQWEGLSGVKDAALLWLQIWRRFHDELAVPSPTIARAFDWLERNCPDRAGGAALLHSDFGLGNLLIADDEITAVLDWEASHMGDPAEEVAWVAYNLRDYVQEGDFVSEYTQITGREIDEFSLRFYDVFSAVKMCLGGAAALDRFNFSPMAEPIFCHLTALSMDKLDMIDRSIERAEATR